MGILAGVTGGSDRRSRLFVLAGSRLPAGAVVAALVLLGASAPAGAQTLAWSVVPSPNPGSGDVLEGVSCVSAAACTAVGWHASNGGPERTLIESWDGTRWSVVPSPSPGTTINFLYGVSCASTAACTAVGYRQGGVARTLIESWNGTRWSVVPSPSPGASAGNYNFLHGVSCASAGTCTAVGSHINGSNVHSAFIESWNGTRWSVVPSPSPGTNADLDGVSCVWAAACTAVGSYVNGSGVGSTLVESWNGTSWSVVPSPNPAVGGRLSGVSCVSAAACTAVGSYSAFLHGSPVGRTLIEFWNGTSWSVVPSPNPGVPGKGNYLDSVSCVSAACIAAGSHVSRGVNSTLVESWNSTRWSVVPSRNPGTGGNFLDGVSCVSPAACTAVGDKINISGGVQIPRTLIESGAASAVAGHACPAGRFRGGC